MNIKDIKFKSKKFYKLVIIVDRFIEKIIISKEGRVELEWKFENIFQDIKSA